ncbi:Caspase domain-containing protein [Hathewaya proteolytica DSM 3090]|uniref:Caspase domain-containing protein n=1 Tax=Hathewaya proteolytica DSM 3090 TaxID=1121331 RepID=A0A1M6N1M5_9CLOT|nr:caspase family protein [Hathewaya proteolytica]SHJ89609.1 Caspase domain-containing protein [Hathewaya proteolytica DSM 3090]
MNVSRGLAIVIANEQYQNCNPLPSCSKDGVDMSTILKRLGFDVLEAYDYSRNDLFQQISNFLNVAESYSTVLLYYSGHGVQIDGENYLVPVDCTPIDNKTIMISTGLVPIRVVTEYMSAHPQKTNIMVLDACRTSPAFTKNIFSGGLAEMKSGSGTFIAFATSPNTVAIGSSSPTKNSIFTECLLEHIEKPNIKIEDLFKLVRNDVDKRTNGTQVPWESTSLMSDFCFNIMNEDEINERIYQSLRNLYMAETLIGLSKYFTMSISDIIRTYLHQKSEKPGGIYFSDKEELEEYILHILLEFGFEFNHYRWMYKDNPVIMGELYHNPARIALQPVRGCEVHATFNLYQPIIDNIGCVISGSTSLPQYTNLMINLVNTDLPYSAQSKASVNEDGEFSSQPFSRKGLNIPKGEYTVIISMPIASVQPTSVQLKIGERGKNLAGLYVKLDVLSGKSIEYKQMITVQY